ncbi:DUF350 domain-containing protein [Paenibacillus sonchi]|uniref:DUF350 domain-containing protein n=3 Tax=Paenibacillus sonchi group TaxID=2044880 RepID=A0A974PAM7_9BACL|nr:MULTISPECIES: DUF350 domain-containing protein [Paenibacillus sonchi group]KWX78426.1 cell surface protein [Paenibacillus riograndensis]KWX87079.1 cell surface protein [Paenibacillus riograndensis]MCE3201268.1 DUF350 domain-containing protein [Paenibacillus sonchi]QQZ59976.1 DUF350 domain-containing protein [Paenibacillus sonchi]CQR56185.1 surface protein [Paenibacillus riograndensis SBR5]
MDFHILVSMVVWTVSGSVLLCVLMYVDSLFTRYNDLEEIKAGNMAVTMRFVLKLLAQGYILSSSIASSNSLGDALVVSIVSFVLLFFLEKIVRLLLFTWAKLDLDHGTQLGKIGYGVLAGSLHVTGALIIAAFIRG